MTQPTMLSAFVTWLNYSTEIDRKIRRSFMRLIKPHHSGLQWVHLLLNIVSMQPTPIHVSIFGFQGMF